MCGGSHGGKFFIVVVPGLMPEAFRGKRLRLHTVSDPSSSCEARGCQLATSEQNLWPRGRLHVVLIRYRRVVLSSSIRCAASSLSIQRLVCSSLVTRSSACRYPPLTRRCYAVTCRRWHNSGVLHAVTRRRGHLPLFSHCLRNCESLPVRPLFVTVQCSD